jgi:Cu/Ag efflux pump CusA
VERAAQDIARALAGVPGSANVRPESQTGSPELVVRVRQDEAARRGLRNAEVLDAVHAAFQGAEVGQVYDRNRIINLVAILDPRARTGPEAVADLWLSVPVARGADAGGRV